MNPVRSTFSLALIGLVLAACGPGGASLAPGSEAPSGPPSATSSGVAATVAPTGPTLPTGEPTGLPGTPQPPAALLVDSLVSADVDRLNIREGPSLDAKIVGLAVQGDFLYIDDESPYSNDGYTWYAAAFLAKASEPPGPTADARFSDGVRGWVAVGKGDTSYVERLPPRCPTAIDLASVQHLVGSELVECFGDSSFELTGTFGCSGCGGARPGTFEPEWLAHPLNFNFLTPYPVGDNLGPFVLHFAPDGPQPPPAGSVIRIRGHVGDPAAATCAMSVIDPLEPSGETFVEVPTAVATLICAQHFVVESVEELGTDSGFVFS